MLPMFLLDNIPAISIEPGRASSIFTCIVFATSLSLLVVAVKDVPITHYACSSLGRHQREEAGKSFRYYKLSIPIADICDSERIPWAIWCWVEVRSIIFRLFIINTGRIWEVRRGFLRWVTWGLFLRILSLIWLWRGFILTLMGFLSFLLCLLSSLFVDWLFITLWVIKTWWRCEDWGRLLGRGKWPFLLLFGWVFGWLLLMGGFFGLLRSLAYILRLLWGLCWSFFGFILKEKRISIDYGK